MEYIGRLAENFLNKQLSTPKVAIILGARQVGKTTLVRHALKEKKCTLLNLDIEIDKARLLAAASLPPVNALKSLGNPEVLVIDEAQRLPETGRIVKGWHDEKVPLKIILLGSSSLSLLNQAAESLTGRNHKLYLPPLLFKEILSTQEWYNPDLPKDTLRENFSDTVKSLLLEALVFGLYPEVWQSDDKEGYLLNLTSDYLLKDVIQSGLIKTPGSIKTLLVLLANQIGEELSTNELSTRLNLSRQTIDKYLDLLEQSYVIFRLTPFSTGQRSEISKSQKFYFWDTGVRNALLKEFNLSAFRSDIDRVWQNWIIAEIAKLNLLGGERQDLHFWRNKDGGKIDLIVKDHGQLKAYLTIWHPNKKTGSTIPGRSFQQLYGSPVEPISPPIPEVVL